MWKCCLSDIYDEELPDNLCVFDSCKDCPYYEWIEDVETCV